MLAKDHIRNGHFKKAVELLEEAQVYPHNNLIKYTDKHQGDKVEIDYFAVSLPNLLIFEDDLDNKNNTHCYFMRGPGELGLEKFGQAKQTLSDVLVLDAEPEHLGARTHLDMAA